MSNVYVNALGVPRKARNGRIYGGVSFNITNASQTEAAGSQRHFETGRLTNLTSNSVIVYFTQSFNTTPFCVNLKVYRLIENIPGGGKWIMQDVLHYFDDEEWAISIGFSLFIDPLESLNGVIIDYCFTE